MSGCGQIGDRKSASVSRSAKCSRCRKAARWYGCRIRKSADFLCEGLLRNPQAEAQSRSQPVFQGECQAQPHAPQIAASIIAVGVAVGGGVALWSISRRRRSMGNHPRGFGQGRTPPRVDGKTGPAQAGWAGICEECTMTETDDNAAMTAEQAAVGLALRGLQSETREEMEERPLR